MATGALDTAIVIVSETAFLRPQIDETGPSLKEAFDEEQHWRVSKVDIVPDDILSIQRRIVSLADGPESPHLILASGGTGFAVKDVTPEAVGPLLHRHAPGLVHGMLAASLDVTPFAMMSRPVAGIRDRTVIVTLPGSPKGACENLRAIIKLLPHACRQAAGEDSRSMHAVGMKKLEQDAGLQNVTNSTTHKDRLHSQFSTHHQHYHHGHGHGHSHGHKIPVSHTDSSARHRSNDPQLGPSARNRQSPFPIVSVEEALQAVRDHVPASVPKTVPVDSSLIGHVVAADTEALEAVPAFRASIVDGYAIRILQGNERNDKGSFSVGSTVHAAAGRDQASNLHGGQVARITTGAPVPEGSNAVVMVEDTEVLSMSLGGREETRIKILTDLVKRGENIREVGSDVQKGDVVMRASEGINALGGEFGLLASVGVREVSVFVRPTVGILSTGDEIVPHSESPPLKKGEVRDTNRPSLLAAVRHFGFEAVDLGIVEDKQETLESMLSAALLRVDVLITSGGVSMGELDLLKPTIERNLGGIIHFGRVAMKPGKPTTFATVPIQSSSEEFTSAEPRTTTTECSKTKVIFSLPGNPASAIVTFLIFALPALNAMSGIKPAGLPRIKVKLAHDIRCDEGREEYHRAIIGQKDQVTDGTLWAWSTGGQRSSRIGSFKAANGLVRLPRGGGNLVEGSVVDAYMIDLLKGLAGR